MFFSTYYRRCRVLRILLTQARHSGITIVDLLCSVAGIRSLFLRPILCIAHVTQVCRLATAVFSSHRRFFRGVAATEEIIQIQPDAKTWQRQQCRRIELPKFWSTVFQDDSYANSNRMQWIRRGFAGHTSHTDRLEQDFQTEMIQLSLHF